MCISILSERITAMNISQQFDAQPFQRPETVVPLVTVDTVESGSSFMARHHGSLLKIGSVVTAGYVAFQALNGLIDGFPGNNQDHGHITTEVKHVAPLDLDCMTVMQAEVDGHIRSKLFGLFGGFTADIKTDTETLVCMHKAGVAINEQVDGSTDITIDAARSTVIFTRMDESKRQQTQGNANGISGFGGCQCLLAIFSANRNFLLVIWGFIFSVYLSFYEALYPFTSSLFGCSIFLVDSDGLYRSWTNAGFNLLASIFW